MIFILVRLDLIFSISLWKEFRLSQILNDLSIKHLIELIFYKNDVKLLNFREVPYQSICDFFEVWDSFQVSIIKTSYKISLIKCLIDRSFKICNNWSSFHNDIENIKSDLIKNAYPPFLIGKVIKKYLDQKFPSNQNQLKGTSDVYHFKLPHIGNLSHTILEVNFWSFPKNFVKSS